MVAAASGWRHSVDHGFSNPDQRLAAIKVFPATLMRRNAYPRKLDSFVVARVLHALGGSAPPNRRHPVLGVLAYP